MLKRAFFIVAFVLTSSMQMFIEPHEVLMQDKKRPGHNQIYVDPPRVTYDEELNELTVYFGSTGTVDIEYVDAAACSRAEPRSRLSLETLKLLVNSPLN